MTADGIGALFAVIGFAITVAGLIGVAFRVGHNTQTVSNYREAADAWEAKAKAQADEIADLQSKLTAAENTIGTMQGRLKLLEDMVTGRAAIEQLTSQLASGFADIRAQIQILTNVKAPE